MSKMAKFTFYGSVGFTLGTIAYIHYEQGASRDRLMDGVAKDMERQEQRRFENMYVLEQQLELSKKLQANQGLVVEET